jgi:hypothetical protein
MADEIIDGKVKVYNKLKKKADFADQSSLSFMVNTAYTWPPALSGAFSKTIRDFHSGKLPFDAVTLKFNELSAQVPKTASCINHKIAFPWRPHTLVTKENKPVYQEKAKETLRKKKEDPHGMSSYLEDLKKTNPKRYEEIIAKMPKTSSYINFTRVADINAAVIADLLNDILETPGRYTVKQREDAKQTLEYLQQSIFDLDEAKMALTDIHKQNTPKFPTKEIVPVMGDKLKSYLTTVAQLLTKHPLIHVKPSILSDNLVSFEFPFNYVSNEGEMKFIPSSFNIIMDNTDEGQLILAALPDDGSNQVGVSEVLPIEDTMLPSMREIKAAVDQLLIEYKNKLNTGYKEGAIMKSYVNFKKTSGIERGVPDGTGPGKDSPLCPFNKSLVHKKLAVEISDEEHELMYRDGKTYQQAHKIVEDRKKESEEEK